ncbi:MAG: hypothetical protein RLZZ577_80 [Bacteroidota bacterium]|jgi:hypothetical protein
MHIEQMQNLIGKIIKPKNKNCVLDGKFEMIINVKNFDFWVV